MLTCLALLMYRRLRWWCMSGRGTGRGVRVVAGWRAPRTSPSLEVHGDFEVEWTRENGGVTAFEVEGTGFFVIHYGRPAADGETYLATQSSPYCAAWRGRRVGDLRLEIENSLETIRWQMFNTSDYRLTEVQQPDANAFVQDVVPLSTRESIIIVSDKENSLPTNGEC